MADRQGGSSPSKPTSNRSGAQGLSLASLASPLNFGPSLLPTSAGLIAPNNPVSSMEPSSVASATPEKVGEAGSTLSQQSTPLQGQQPSSQQQAQDSVPLFTMSSSSSPFDDQFLPPQPASGASQTFPYQPFTQTPPQQTSSQASPQAPSPQTTPKQTPPPNQASPQQLFSQPAAQSPYAPSPHQLPSHQPPFPQTPPQPTLNQQQQWNSPSQTSPQPTPPQATPEYHVPPPTPSQISLDPVQPHWFYMKDGHVWVPFSFIDSNSLEQALRLQASGSGAEEIVATNGGRYDVDLDQRLRHAIYWEENVSVVRRCMWFYKGAGEAKLVPYPEDLSTRLEAEFTAAVKENVWPRRVDLAVNEYIMMHNMNVMVHFCSSTEQVDWTGEDSITRPKVVRRGIGDIQEEIEDGEPAQVDHLVFVVHGIGPIADLKFRNIIECVDDFRKVTLDMLNDHHEELARGHSIGRVEFLPVQWHSKLHNDSTGIDKRLQSISLSSISTLRDFTNSTLVDILFYTSPTYCQNIVNTVGTEMHKLLKLFRKRNPSFTGQISVCGHSLGSGILFDILSHQFPGSKVPPQGTTSQAAQDSESDQGAVKATSVLEDAPEESSSDEEDASETGPSLQHVLSRLGLQDYIAQFELERIDMESLLLCSEQDMKDMQIPLGPRKKLMIYLKDHAHNVEKWKNEREGKRAAKAAKKKSRESKKPPNEANTGSSASPPEADDGAIGMVRVPRSSSAVPLLSPVASVEVVFQPGVAGTGQPYVEYPQLNFEPFALFVLGSPIGMFMTVRGVTQLSAEFHLPTCARFFNIFHPYDPVAYRIEPLVDPSVDFPPVLMPHHKGRKRMHLELRENLSRLGENLRLSLIESARKTWESIHEFARGHTSVSLEDRVEIAEEQKEDSAPPEGAALADSNKEAVTVGHLNRGERIDYVLQEKPIESLNEYLFALSSHVCYWLSEDTALFMLKQIYRD